MGGTPDRAEGCAGEEVVPPTGRAVLVVDDDAAMRRMIADYLGDHGFRVTTAANGSEMAQAIAGGATDLVLLDLKLPDEDGLTLIRSLRAESGVPIIAMTGHRRDEVDRVVGLELGADDYVTKPFGLRELLARIRAVLRRGEVAPSRPEALEGGDGAGEKRRPTRYRFAGWELDLRARRLASPDGEPVSLTRGEFNLLTAFLQSPRRVLSREQLLAASRVHDEEVFDRSIDVQILRLRRKLETDPSQPELIRTERGVGYVLAVAVESG
jgi:DNA-binding response OmpR family regulator